MISLLAKKFIKNREDVTSPAVRQAYGMLCGIVGIVLGSKARKETPSPMADGGFICSIVSTCISGAAIVCALCALGTLVSLFA